MRFIDGLPERFDFGKVKGSTLRMFKAYKMRLGITKNKEYPLRGDIDENITGIDQRKEEYLRYKRHFQEEYNNLDIKMKIDKTVRKPKPG